MMPISSKEEKAVEDVGGRWQPNDILDGFVYFRFLSSRCIHKILDGSGSLFACGRSISTRYERQAERPKFFHPLCGTCFQIIMLDFLTCMRWKNACRL